MTHLFIIAVLINLNFGREIIIFANSNRLAVLVKKLTMVFNLFFLKKLSKNNIPSSGLLIKNLQNVLSKKLRKYFF